MVFLLPFIAMQATTLGAPQYWQGDFVKKGSHLHVALRLGAKSGEFSCPAQAAMDYPLQNVSFDGRKCGFALGSMKFEGEMVGKHLVGAFTADDGTGTFDLTPTSPPIRPYIVRNLVLRAKGANLAATICLPRRKKAQVGVVLLHGSGPQTRWGTLRYMADVLARRGVASVCWDQRGSGDSTGVGSKPTTTGSAPMRFLPPTPSRKPSANIAWSASTATVKARRLRLYWHLEEKSDSLSPGPRLLGL